ncbi:MAG: HNH endonuclease [Bacteroidetes bacterium]|nr:HNH endonuclease [Bacteroidota bacterium]
MNRVKEIFQSISIRNFVEYYEIFEKHKESSSNKEIIDAFKQNNEDWSDKACATRASKGKLIFKENLELDALRYVINSANVNKISKEVVEKAYDKYSRLQGIQFKNLSPANPESIEKLLTSSEVALIEKNTKLSNEEKTSVIKIRLGQSFYRNELIELWQGCAVTKCKNTDLLISSHIKPFKDCSEEEKYDKYNGLLLTPNYDKLFDNYLISFSDDGEILISQKIKQEDLVALNINVFDKLIKVYPENIKYLKYHREIFRKNQ